jgi:hypothetical protein
MAINPSEPTPATPSSAYDEMKPALDMISAIMKGAMAVRAAGKEYLPQYPAEGRDEYQLRLASAPWRPEFEDAIRSLSSKPFSKEIAVQSQTSARIKAILEDVDTLGNSLQRFARQSFQGGIAKGYHGILVDFPVADNGTLADERASGARPYWVQVPAENLIALYTQIVGGRTIVTHARVLECIVEREGFGEKVYDQVRVLEPGTWAIWRQNEKEEWFEFASGESGLTEVPLVIFYAGQRSGEVVQPPLLNLADMQIELYRALSRQDEILTYAGSPMLAANGMAKGDEEIQVGPRRVLYAAPGGDGGGTPNWAWIQPDAANITAVGAHVQSIIEDMKRLGMQPLTQKTGSPTATGQAIEGAKAHSAVQDWALAFKDALEQCLVYTSQWLDEPETAEVSIDTDFSIDLETGAELDSLLKLRATADISRPAIITEFKRRGVLSADYDEKADEQLIAEEQQGLQPDIPIDPVTGRPLQPKLKVAA